MPKKSRAKNNTNSEKEFVLFPYGAEDEILPKPLKGPPTSRVALVRRLRRRAARLRIAYEFSISFVADHVGNARANSCLIHDFERLVFCIKKRRGKNALPFFGAEDEIRTRATGKGTTPLAGEPLEPLGYFCISCCAAARSRAHTLYHKRGELSKYIFPNFQKKSKKSCAHLAGAGKVC